MNSCNEADGILLTHYLLVSISALAMYGGKHDITNEHIHLQSPIAKTQDLISIGRRDLFLRICKRYTL
jgi:hypothetical protein